MKGTQLFADFYHSFILEPEGLVRFFCVNVLCCFCRSYLTGMCTSYKDRKESLYEMKCNNVDLHAVKDT